MDVLFLKPLFVERIWGGTKLNRIYGYEILSDTTGECWAISAHKDGCCQIANGEFEGMSLQAVYENHPEIFGHPISKVFPLLTKIIDAADTLSVQVHPEDDYALKYEGDLGKSECWYVIDADEDAQIIYGHNAKSKEEFEAMIRAENWNELLNVVNVKKGDFFYVPAGTVHGIGKGILVLEIQQNSNITYRLYDYDRCDAFGNKRELHIDKALDVCKVPSIDSNCIDIDTEILQEGVTKLLECEYFEVYKWEIDGDIDLSHFGKYTIVSVLEGNGRLDTASNSYLLERGMHFIIPATLGSWKISGKLECIASNPV